ncbi:MAG: 7TM-DISM domain-containing protein, partial [Bacteroidota bacterium]|nr:7TM-DISM domain-containing protein [Bacteroidota bacterium]
MKHALIIILLLSALNCLSQSFVIDSIPGDGILLNKGWKFTTGDNPDYARPGFNDNAWQSINPTLDVHDSLPQLQNGICWLRLHLFLNSYLAKSPLSFIIQQSGASEIYLNGTKIKSYGTVSADAIKVKAYDPLWKPLSLPFITGSDQVLAVRYALQRNVLYTKIFETENPALSMRIMHTFNAVDYYHKNASKLLSYMSLQIGIGIMLMILHFSFYFLYPSQKANLYFALFACTWVLANFTQLNFWLYPGGVANKFYLGNGAFGLYILGYVFLLIAAYNFLERKKDFFYYSLLMISGVAVILDMWPYGLGWKIGGPIQEVLVQINLARIALIAVSKKQRGAWIIAAGAICTFIFFVAFLLQGTFTNTSFILSLPELRIFTYEMFGLSLPVA